MFPVLKPLFMAERASSFSPFLAKIGHFWPFLGQNQDFVFWANPVLRSFLKGKLVEDRIFRFGPIFLFCAEIIFPDKSAKI